MINNSYKSIRALKQIIKVMVLSLFFVSTVLDSNNVLALDGSDVYSNRVELTSEEQAYMEEHPQIVVATDASWRPLEYVKDNQYSGVVANVLGKLSQYTGFEIEYKIMGSYSEALNAVQSGEADMISGLADDEKMAEEYNVNLTEPFLTINSAVVSKNDVSSLYETARHKKIAVVSGDYENKEIKEKIVNAELIECKSNAECLKKVRDDKVDMAIIASYCAEYYSSVPKYSNYKNHTVPDFSWQLSFGVNKNIDPRMLSILNKGIMKMSQVDLSESIYEGIIEAEYDNDLMAFVYKHPIFVISVVLVIVCIMVVLISIILILKKKENRRQREDATRLRIALERTHLCIWEIDASTKTVKQIDNEHEKHGFYELRDNIPESAIEHGYVHPDDVKYVKDVFKQIKAGEKNIQGCWRIKEKNVDTKGTTYWWEHVQIYIIFDEHRKPIKAIGVSEDVTKEKESQRDSLTLVYNRSSFEQKASSVLNERRNSYLQCAFLILDLDGFKSINDTYGHGMGDKVLISVGATLNKTFRSTDIVGRLGGDEFTVFMTSVSKREDVISKAEEIVMNINGISEKQGYEFPISCSVGVVIATKGQEELSTMYKKADTALYEAKRAGKNQYRLYE